jgi:hypothetical protein
MKKEVILILTFLLSLELVNAQQEITILGNSYPIILVVPIFFMAIITLFFLGLIIKDNIGKIKIPKIHLGKIKIKHEKTKAAKEIKIDVRTRFDVLKEKASRIGALNSLNEFSEIVSEFFKQKFNIKHEFAFAELGNLIKGHIKDIDLATKISDLKYSGKSVDLAKIRVLFKEFEDLLGGYKFKIEGTQLRFFDKLKDNLFRIFRKKEAKPSIKELRIKAPTPIKEIHEKEIIKEKPNIFSNIFNIFKRKELKIKRVELKPKKIKEEVIAEKEIKPVKKYRFILFTNLLAKIQKFRILNLIKHGKNALLINPLLAKRDYARALLAYYKLPIKEEKDIADKLMELYNGILNIKANERIFLSISKNLIEAKHKGKPLSKEIISIVNTLKNFIEREELLASTKLKEFSHKLKNEERRLIHFAKREEQLIGRDIKGGLGEVEVNIKSLAERESGLLKESGYDIKHFLRKEEHKIGEFLDEEKGIIGKEIRDIKRFGKRFEHKKEFIKPEIAQKTINLVDKYNPRLEFLYKQPKLKIEHEAGHEEKPKVTTKQLRVLQKERNELYNKLLELESGKITHNKLN